MIQTPDHLGLHRIETLIEKLRQSIPAAGPAEELFQQLSESLVDARSRYDLLKDRYSLLKRSNAALCDEVVWLRDQIDDLVPLFPGEPS